MHKNNNLRKSMGTQMFYFTYGLKLTLALISASLVYDKYENNFHSVFNICNALVLFLLVLIITVFQSYSFNEIVVIGTIYIIFQIASIKSGEEFIVLTWLFICASKNIDIKMIAKETIFLSLLTLIVFFGLTREGIIEVSIMGRLDGRLRYSIGYGNPNQLGFVLLQLMIALTIKANSAYKLLDFIVLILTFLFSDIVLNCRSVSICIVLLVVFNILFRYQCSHSFRYIGILIAIFVPVGSLYLSTIYNPTNNWMKNLNSILSYRIELSNDYIDNFGFSLMGSSLDLTLLGALDNAYVRAAVFYGLIPLTIYMYGITRLLASKNNSNRTELICIVIMIVYGLMESMVFSINCNFVLLILARILYKKHNIYCNNVIISKKFGRN